MAASYSGDVMTHIRVKTKSLRRDVRIYKIESNNMVRFKAPGSAKNYWSKFYSHCLKYMV